MDSYEDNQKSKKDSITVSSSALNKLFTIADIMKNLEFRVCSVSKPGEKYIYDFLIPVQKVEPAHVSSDKHSFGFESFDIRFKKNLSQVGIAHGHGNFGVTHSDTDHNNIDKALKDFGGNNYDLLKVELPLMHHFIKKIDDSYVMNASGEYRVNLDFASILKNKSLSYDDIELILNSLSVETGELKSISSLIVNRHGDIEAIKRYQLTKFIFSPEELELDKLYKGDYPLYANRINNEFYYTFDVDIIDSEDSEQVEWSEDSLRNELESKIELPRNYISHFGRKGGFISNVFKKFKDVEDEERSHKPFTDVKNRYNQKTDNLISQNELSGPQNKKNTNSYDLIDRIIEDKHVESKIESDYVKDDLKSINRLILQGEKESLEIVSFYNQQNEKGFDAVQNYHIKEYLHRKLGINTTNELNEEGRMSRLGNYESLLRIRDRNYIFYPSDYERALKKVEDFENDDIKP